MAMHRRRRSGSMRRKNIGPNLLMIAAIALAVTIVGPAEAKHDHGSGGGHGGGPHRGWDWHGDEAWHGAWHDGGRRHGDVGWHDNGRRLGWYKHGGAALSPRPMAGVGRALSVPVWAGGIGGSPGAGAASAGDGAPNHGPGAACWLVPRSAWWLPLP